MQTSDKKYRRANPDSSLIIAIAIALGCGIAAYFSLSGEPPLLVVGFFLAASLAALGIFWRDNRKKTFLMLLASLLLGFTLATIRSQMVAAPKLHRETGPVLVSGTIVTLDRRVGNDLRLTLANLKMDRVLRAGIPARVRITIRTKRGALAIGDRVEMLAILNPPPEPVAPDAFDFARQAWFTRLGAVGYAVSVVTKLDAAPERRLSDRINHIRDRIDRRVRSILTGPSGGIASALLTGLRGGIDQSVQEDMRIAGLAHILAISGLHMGLVAGLLFFAVRALLALFPTLALRYPIKKIAAGVAWFGALLYLGLSGGTIPTQRAFVMVSIALFAILVDRQAISMRTVALAAILILLTSPEALFSVSFQMSFAAVIALVAAYQYLAGPITMLRQRWHGPPGRAALFFMTILLTSIIAQLAIEPIAAFHFNRMSTFGIVANLIAVPMLGMWILPWGIVALILMPFGLESLALIPMGYGIDAVIWSAHEVAVLPGAQLLVPSFPMAALALLIVGYLWALLWPVMRWKALALLPIGLALAVILFSRYPDLLISRDGDLIAVKGSDGDLYLSSLRRESFTRESWLRRNAQRDALSWEEEKLIYPVRCDPDGCIWRTASKDGSGFIISVAFTVGALIEDCRKADLVINLARVNLPCAATEITWQDIARDGAHAVWLGQDIRILAANQARGTRPWTE